MMTYEYGNLLKGVREVCSETQGMSIVRKIKDLGEIRVKVSEDCPKFPLIKLGREVEKYGTVLETNAQGTVIRIILTELAPTCSCGGTLVKSFGAERLLSGFICVECHDMGEKEELMNDGE